MSEDKRSRRVVAVIHCILNQNARAQKCAVYAGANTDVIEVLARHGVGMLQMPCPEMDFMGLDRARGEDQTIWDIIDTPEGHSFCRDLAKGVVDSIEDYLKNGYSVEAVLGGDTGSPGCAVRHLAPEAGVQGLAENSGVLMRELMAELHSREIDIPFRGMHDSSPEALAEDIAWLDETLRAANG